MFRIRADDTRNTQQCEAFLWDATRKLIARVACCVVCLLPLCLILIVACSPKMSEQIMASQPKYKPLQDSESFDDGMSARPLISDTVARGQLRDDTLLYTGKLPDGTLANVFPFPVTRELLERGQQRFNIFCAPCHGRVGNGNGLVAQRGYPRPPSFHTDALRAASLGHFFEVMTNGFGVMPSYADQVPARDRWAIIAYIRALQLSQHATLGDVPADERQKLESR